MDAIVSLLQQRPRADWRWTLQPAHREFRRDNALALANCSLLAYGDPADMAKRLCAPALGFEKVDTFSGRQGRGDTQGYVATRADAIVVALRGTEPLRARDYLTDTRALQVPFETHFETAGWGRVHQGFAEAGQYALEKIRALLHDADPQLPLWITGHSLGGALAVIVSAGLVGTPPIALAIAGVYTFGQPRVGDPTFCAKYDEVLGVRTFRCVNDRDLIPRVPPENLPLVGRYAHAGQLRLLLREAGSLSRRSEDEAARGAHTRAAGRTLEALLRSPFGGLLELLKDRAPLRIPAGLRAGAGPLIDHAPIGIPQLRSQGYVDRIEALPPDPA